MKKGVCLILSLVFAVLTLSLKCRALSAVSAVLINADTGEVLYSESKDLRLPMASTTKIMTALLLCESAPDIKKEITVPEAAVKVEGTSMGLKGGDKVSIEALLYGMLLASGNDAANTAAYAVSGDMEAFVALMNQKAADLGLNNTHFATPSGLDGEGHYTTAYELAVLAREALKNPLFAKVCATKSITLSYGTPAARHTLTNHNRLLKEYSDIVGVKTGYTSAAGRCLVTAAETEGKRLICVTLNDKNDWQDHRELLDKGYELLKERESFTADKTVAIPIASGGSVKLQIPKLNYYSASNGKMTVKCAVPKFIYLPVKKGEVLGYARYYYEYKSVKRLALTASKDIKEQKKPIHKRIITVFYALICSV